MSDNPTTKLPQSDPWQQLTDESKHELEDLFAAMQTEQHRKGAEHSFTLSSEVLGDIALKRMNLKA